MRVGVRSVVAARKACTVVLLGVVTIAMVVPVRDVAMGQGASGSQPPMYTAKDLNPAGFTNSQAFGIADGQQVGVGFNRRPNGVPDTLHALLWRGTAGSVVDLTPSGFLGAEAFGTSGGKQVGIGVTSSGSHALLWSGTAASVVDLHVSGFTDPAGGTVATGITGNQQVGWKQAGYGVLPPDQRGVRASHALLWSGTAGSVVDLHPPTFDFSGAFGLSGGQQVGVGRVAGDFAGHARLWSGSAASVTALDESGFDTCTARGISGGQQVGNCLGPNAHGAGHAVLWSGGVLDLNPSGFAGSQALGTNGTQQVGWGVIVGPGGAHSHALVWSGSASRVVDLHQFLRQGDFIESVATGIDARGNIAGYALASDGVTVHAFLWTPSAVAVIILPGVPGSWTSTAADIVNGSPAGQILNVGTLINELRTMIATHLSRDRLKQINKYDTLISTLKTQGVQTFVMPYDWANGGSQKAADDLDKFIESIRNMGFDQVDIIAHSTGGLVAQQYIQNRLNASADPHVRNLFMLGTPNQGAVKAHCFIFASVPCLWTVVSLFDVADQAILLMTELGKITPASIETIGQLMPTFPYLVDIDTKPRQFIPNPRPTPTCGNGCLFDNVYTSSLTAWTRGQLDNGVFQSAGINVYAVQGTGWPTASTIAVRPRRDPRVALDASRESGDTTVLVQSARILARGVTNIAVPGAVHASSLIDCGASVYLSIIRGTTTSCSTPLPRFVPRPILIQTHSPVKILLTDPLGRTTGFDFATGTNVANIPTSVLLDSDSPGIFLSEGVRGQYRLELLGIGTGGAFRLDIAYPNAFPTGFDTTGEEVSGTIAPRQRLRFIFDAFAFQDVTNLFAAFQARLEINSASRAFEMNSTFTLGSGGTISPATQPVTIQVGNGFLVTIPAGSFRPVGNGTRFVFEGTVNGVALEANLASTGGNTYSFKIEGAGARSLPPGNPVEVRLGIGNNGGSVSVDAERD